MCDCLDKENEPYKWIIKPYGELFQDSDVKDLDTELSAPSVITIDITPKRDCIPLGEFFWLVDLGDGVLYKVKEFTDEGYILEDEPWNGEGSKIY